MTFPLIQFVPFEDYDWQPVIYRHNWRGYDHLEILASVLIVPPEVAPYIVLHWGDDTMEASICYEGESLTLS